MIPLETILPTEIVQQLGWTLLHFVWQAAALALVLAIVLRFLRRSSANLRYTIACACLALIAVTPVMTFCLVSAPGPRTYAEPVSIPAVPTPESPGLYDTDTPLGRAAEYMQMFPATHRQPRLVGLTQALLPYIVFTWLVGVLSLSAWHFGGWMQMQRLKSRMARQTGPALQSKLRELAKLLGIRRAVQLLESSLVEVPTVIGWLRPILLLPASALTGLSAEQLEAVLAHELAHIKRYDYLVNMLQTAVEILGFYHPAVWWVSRRIRAERENCCDDVAVNVCGDKVCYARALASLEQLRAGPSELALTARGGSLFARISRLVGRTSEENRRSSLAPLLIVALLTVTVAIPTFALTEGASQKSDTEPIESYRRVDDSAERLLNLGGRALLVYANDYGDKYPDTLQQLQGYLNEEDLKWALENVEYLGKGKTTADPPHIVIGYDKTLLAEAEGTNVLFNDSHVELVTPEELKRLGVSTTEIQIEARILSVSEDFLQDIGLDANSIHDANAWPEPAPLVLGASDGFETYSLMLDDLNVSFLLRATQAHEGAKVLGAPRVNVLDGKKASIAVQKASHYISAYAEPNRPSGKPEPKHDSVNTGLQLQVTPKTTSDKQHIHLHIDFELSNILGFESCMYKGKYQYETPQIEKVHLTSQAALPDGKTLLIGGPEITQQVRTDSRVPMSGDLPVVGRLFGRDTWTGESRILLLLVKPTVPPEPAEPVGGEEADSKAL